MTARRHPGPVITGYSVTSDRLQVKGADGLRQNVRDVLDFCNAQKNSSPCGELLSRRCIFWVPQRLEAATATAATGTTATATLVTATPDAADSSESAVVLFAFH